MREPAAPKPSCLPGSPSLAVTLTSRAARTATTGVGRLITTPRRRQFHRGRGYSLGGVGLGRGWSSIAVATANKYGGYGALPPPPLAGEVPPPPPAHARMPTCTRLSSPTQSAPEPPKAPEWHPVAGRLPPVQPAR